MLKELLKKLQKSNVVENEVIVKNVGIKEELKQEKLNRVKEELSKAEMQSVNNFKWYILMGVSMLFGALITGVAITSIVTALNWSIYSRLLTIFFGTAAAVGTIHFAISKTYEKVEDKNTEKLKQLYNEKQALIDENNACKEEIFTTNNLMPSRSLKNTQVVNEEIVTEEYGNSL